MIEAIQRIRFFSVAAFALALSAGCGGSRKIELPKAKVTGTVTYAGHEIPNGRLMFQHEQGEMTAAPFGADGKYEALVPVGKNRVMIDAKKSSFEDAPKSGVRGMETFTHYVPKRYADFPTSNLSLDVPGSGTTFDVAIKE